MKTSPKAVALALLLMSPVVVAAQAPPQERKGPADAPGWDRGMGPRFQGRMGSPGGHSRGGQWMRGHGARRFSLGRLLQNPHFRERLGVTPEQAAKIREQEATFAKARVRSRADLTVKRMELAELLAAEKPDRALLEKKLREISEARFATEKSALDHRLAMREALTPEQREKLKQMVEEFRAPRMDRSFGRFPGRGPAEPRRPPSSPQQPAI